jgi:hypothetical protein
MTLTDNTLIYLQAYEGRSEILDTMEATLLPQTSMQIKSKMVDHHHDSHWTRWRRKGMGCGKLPPQPRQPQVTNSDYPRKNNADAEVISVAVPDAFRRFMQDELSMKATAPRIRVIRFKRERLQFLLGPGGETKRRIEDQHRCILDIGDAAPPLSSGTAKDSSGGNDLAADDRNSIMGGEHVDCVVHVFGEDEVSCKAAAQVVQELVCDIEVGVELQAIVKDVRDFGAVLQVGSLPPWFVHPPIMKVNWTALGIY